MSRAAPDAREDFRRYSCGCSFRGGDFCRMAAGCGDESVELITLRCSPTRMVTSACPLSHLLRTALQLPHASKSHSRQPWIMPPVMPQLPHTSQACEGKPE